MSNEHTVKLSKRKIEIYEKNAEIVKFLRRNPIIACEQLLGIKLLDAQKWILQTSWNTKYNMWTCSRNFGKSFLIAVDAMLTILLYPNSKLYIMSNKGNQAQETFTKLEEIALQRITSIPSLKDIFINEVVVGTNSNGFIHDKASFKVTTFNGSTVFTLNSVPDNIRGKRAAKIYFDESSFCSSELISAALPFITQDADFKLSTDDGFDVSLLRKEVPNQVIFASSAGDTDSMHYQFYREYAMKMMIGDSNYFSADIPCDIPLAPFVDGEPSPPLLTRNQVDDLMRTNPDKAKREYYNKFQADGGVTQIVKWATIRRNETFVLPQLANNGEDRFTLALDPARTTDNSILSAMKIIYDDEIGYYGEIVNCTNLLDIEKKKKTPMKSPDQIRYIKQSILDYNGNASDYANIDAILLDSGAGGGGISAFADNFLEDWEDTNGVVHRGFIDPTHEQYINEVRNYPNASNILRLISPQKYKTQMIDELLELLRIDVIKFPKEYNGKSEIPITIEGENKNEVEIQYRQLSLEEQIALINLDIMKSETTSIHKFENLEKTSVRYALPKEKEKLMNDDRFYTLIMLAHYLFELRRNDQLAKGKQPQQNTDLSSLLSVFKKPNVRA